MTTIQMETISLGYIDNPKTLASTAKWSFYADAQEQANPCVCLHLNLHVDEGWTMEQQMIVRTDIVYLWFRHQQALDPFAFRWCPQKLAVRVYCDWSVVVKMLANAIVGT